MLSCDDQIQSYETAHSGSAGIFLGELAEIQKIEIDTTHHGKKNYLNGKFRVVKAWKAVDKEFVWVHLPGARTACTEFEKGKVYLVYANQLGNDLFIDTSSRSVTADSTIGIEDLRTLGVSGINISGGEFSLRPGPFIDVLLAISLVATILVFALVWFKKVRAS